MRALLIAVASASVFFTLVGSPSDATGAPRLLSPLVVDWERSFKVDWQATPTGSRTIVSGTIWNTADWAARRIQLLVEGLDANGQVVTQRVVWLGTDLTPGTHAYFDVPVSEPAARYRVSVFAFDPRRPGGGF